MVIIRERVNSTGSKLTGSLRYAIQFVQTPYTCSVQHDLAFTDGHTIDFEVIVEDMRKASFQMKYLVFSRFKDTKTHDLQNRLLGFNRYLGKWSITASERGNHSYAKTATWTDNNHIASTEYLATLYNRCMAPFPEWCMMYARDHEKNYSWENFGGWWYHPPANLLQRQIFHVDGRKSATCESIISSARAMTDSSAVSLPGDGGRRPLLLTIRPRCDRLGLVRRARASECGGRHGHV
jgi:hypothetical protein